MHETPETATEPEPKSTTGEKPSIQKAQEEFIGDEARPSRDRSEVEAPPEDQTARRNRL